MELDKMEEKDNKTFTPEQREAYMLEGGAPHLDGTYTIFGEPWIMKSLMTRWKSRPL